MARISVEEKKELILKFINNCIGNNGYPPTVREICKEFGFSSPSSVHAYIEKLKNEGLLTSEPDKVRTLKVETDRYKPQKEEHIEVLKESISATFELDKTSISILNRYCAKKGVDGNHAIRIAIYELLRLM